VDITTNDLCKKNFHIIPVISSLLIENISINTAGCLLDLIMHYIYYNQSVSSTIFTFALYKRHCPRSVGIIDSRTTNGFEVEEH